VSGLRPGDVVIDEPRSDHGLILQDREGDIVSWKNGDWQRCGEAVTWRDVVDYFPVTVLAVPASLAPADEWEPVEAGDVRVGDDIEVTQEWDHHSARAVHLCKVFAITAPDEGRRRKVQLTPNEPDDVLWIGLLVEGKQETIRRRVRQPMPEPTAPAVVRHAGLLAARPEGDESVGRWLLLSRRLSGDYWWKTWAEMLALDPSTDPVLVDLGGGA